MQVITFPNTSTMYIVEQTAVSAEAMEATPATDNPA
jgi:hypothetical protein